MPLIDLATNVWPFRLGEVGWRYGAVGLLSGFLFTPLIGLCLAAGVAAALAHDGILRFSAFLSGLGAVVLLLITALFCLDVLQIRVEIPPTDQTAFRIGALRAFAKNMAVAVSLVWLAVGAWRGSKSSAA